jgi:hypothetical protein
VQQFAVNLVLYIIVGAVIGTTAGLIGMDETAAMILLAAVGIVMTIATRSYDCDL